MRVYLDSSVVLRIALGERRPLPQWPLVTDGVTSEIARVECLRALDRLRLDGGMSDRELARRRTSTLELLESFTRVRVNRAVLERAAEPFPTRVRSLDAIHVATALLVRDPRLRFATHDDELAVAAEAVGLSVIGV